MLHHPRHKALNLLDKEHQTTNGFLASVMVGGKRFSLE